MDLDALRDQGVISELAVRRARGPLAAKLLPVLERIPLDMPPGPHDLGAVAAPEGPGAALLECWRYGALPWLVGATLAEARAALEPLADALNESVAVLRPGGPFDVLGSYRGDPSALSKALAAAGSLRPILLLDLDHCSELTAPMVARVWLYARRAPHDEGLGTALPIPHALWVAHSTSREVPDPLRSALGPEVALGERDEEKERAAEEARISAAQRHNRRLMAWLRAWQAAGWHRDATLDDLLDIQPEPTDGEDATGIFDGVFTAHRDPRHLSWDWKEDGDSRPMIEAVCKLTGASPAELEALAGRPRGDFLCEVNARLDEGAARFVGLHDLGDCFAVIYATAAEKQALESEGGVAFDEFP